MIIRRVGSTRIAVGLDPADVGRMLCGCPIVVAKEGLRIDRDLVIYFGKDYATMVRDARNDEDGLG